MNFYILIKQFHVVSPQWPKSIKQLSHGVLWLTLEMFLATEFLKYKLYQSFWIVKNKVTERGALL